MKYGIDKRIISVASLNSLGERIREEFHLDDEKFIIQEYVADFDDYVNVDDVARLASMAKIKVEKDEK